MLLHRVETWELGYTKKILFVIKQQLMWPSRLCLIFFIKDL